MIETKLFTLLQTVFSMISIIWNMRSFAITNRRKLSIETLLIFKSIGKYDIRITILNKGKEAITIKNRPIPIYKNVKKSNLIIFHDLIDLISKEGFPIKLEKETLITIEFEITELFYDLENSSCAFFVIDIHGKKYVSNWIKLCNDEPELLLE